MPTSSSAIIVLHFREWRAASCAGKVFLQGLDCHTALPSTLVDYQNIQKYIKLTREKHTLYIVFIKAYVTSRQLL